MDRITVGVGGGALVEWVLLGGKRLASECGRVDGGIVGFVIVGQAG